MGPSRARRVHFTCDLCRQRVRLQRLSGRKQTNRTGGQRDTRGDSPVDIEREEERKRVAHRASSERANAAVIHPELKPRPCLSHNNNYNMNPLQPCPATNMT